MSNVYIQRLRAIRGEFEAARQGIAFVSRNWQKYDVYRELDDVTPANFKRAGEHIFATYLIRLSAEFEGILKYHLTSNHPGILVPKDTKVDWLISKALKAEGFKLDVVLRGNLESVRNFRNSFIHSGIVPPATFTFDAALSWFNTVLARLPNPLT